MRGIGRLVAATIVAAGAAVSAPPVAAASNYLTITGDGSGYVDIKLGGGNKFDLGRARMKGGKKYLAIVFNRLGPPSVEDSVLAVRFAVAETEPEAVVLGHDQFSEEGTPLTAGTWRVYLLADGPATVSVPTTRLRRDVTLKATRRTTARLRLTDIATPLDPGPDGLYQGEARHPFTMDGQAVTIMRIAAEFEQAPVTQDGADLCHAKRGQSCAGIGPTLTHVNQRAQKFMITSYVPRDLNPPGEYDVYGRCFALSPVRRCRLASLDQWIRNTPAQIALTIPEPVRTARPTASASAAPPGVTPPPPLAASGLPGMVGGAAALCALGAVVAGRRHRS